MSEVAQTEKAPPQAEPTANLGDLTLTTKSIQDLNKIIEPAASLIIWQRSLNQSLLNWLSNLTPEQLPSGRVLTDRQNIRKAIGTFFSNISNDDQYEKTLLADDITLLAQKYADITRPNKIDIRLDVIQDDACWKFHLDRVNYRLVTTYLGEGTQYVSPENANEALEKQTDYKGPIKTIREQEVAIFKGSCNIPGTGIVHRSPPITVKQTTRLLLCINARSDVSPDLWNS